MSDNNDHIDPALLSDENPQGLNESEAVNGGIALKGKPRGIRKINNKGLVVGGALLVIAAVVASTTFNQAGSAASTAAKDAVANQGKANGRPAALKRDTLWYADKPDRVAAADQAPAVDTTPATPFGTYGHPAPAPGAAASAVDDPNAVPDLTGRAVNPMTAATQGRVGAPALGSRQGGTGANAGATQANQAQAQAEQQELQTKQRKQQELETAMKSQLTAAGFASKETTQAAPGQGAGASLGAPRTAAAGPAQPLQDDPNGQMQKDAFMVAAKAGRDSDYSSSVKTAARSPYELKASAIIPAVMIGGINSDLPGEAIAQVRENVYDTKTGTHLLIPQGTRLVGLYDAHVAYGQQRVLMAWNRLIFPDGSSFDLKGMPGADKGGYAGFYDEVDNHYIKIFGSAVMMSLISAGVQLSQPNNGTSSTTSTPSVSQTVGAALGQQIGQTAMSITQKNLNIQPTLEIRPGYQFNVMVTADMILPPAAR